MVAKTCHGSRIDAHHKVHSRPIGARDIGGMCRGNLVEECAPGVIPRVWPGCTCQRVTIQHLAALKVAGQHHLAADAENINIEIAGTVAQFFLLWIFQAILWRDCLPKEAAWADVLRLVRLVVKVGAQKSCLRWPNTRHALGMRYRHALGMR